MHVFCSKSWAPPTLLGRSEVEVLVSGWCWYHHGLLDAQVRQQHVVLHDVAGNLPEGAQVSGLTVDQDLPLHPRLPGNGQETPESRSGPELEKNWT